MHRVGEPDAGVPPARPVEYAASWAAVDAVTTAPAAPPVVPPFMLAKPTGPSCTAAGAGAAAGAAAARVRTAARGS
ncbi:hypothetical protein AB0L25_37095 [Spirillospora sp. NPDC052242]